MSSHIRKVLVRGIAILAPAFHAFKGGRYVKNCGVSRTSDNVLSVLRIPVVWNSYQVSNRTFLEMDKIETYIKEDKVFIFSKSYCPYCKRVKNLFKSLNVEYEALELDELGEEGAAIQQMLGEKTGMRTVPNVFVGRHHVGGCDATFKANGTGELRKLLDEVARASQGPSASPGPSPKKTTASYDYDLIVIGGGSGGLAASKEAALLGKKVAVCDFVVPSPSGTTWGLGGTCVNVGCIPKKLMHKAAIIGEDMRDSSSFGWEVSDMKHNWETMVTEIQNYIKSLNFGYRKSLREKNVTYLNAYAKFVDQHTIETRDKKNVTKTITAKNFIVAVGCRPTYPEIPGALECGITSDDIFSLQYHPGKTLIVGASYVALECAGFLNGIGVDCTVMVRSILLRGFDQQMAEMIGQHMSDHGVKFVRPCVPTKIECLEEGKPGKLKVTAKMQDGTVVHNQYNTVIFAIGRTACTKGIGLETVSVATKNSKIIVKPNEQTSVENIYAIGDVIEGKLELTPVAIQAGKLLARRLYGNASLLTDYVNVPTTIFTPLEYGCVGLSEEDARSIYGDTDIEVYHTFYQPLEYALTQRDKNKCYGKLVCVKSLQEKVVGFHVLGPNAGEITQGYGLGIKLGAKRSDFSNLIGIHPTNAEVFTSMDITKSSGASVDRSEC